jgi:hypothetical protein
MRRAARLRGSWRPQLCLARKVLEDGDLLQAAYLYRAAPPAGATSDGNALMSDALLWACGLSFLLPASGRAQLVREPEIDGL